MTIGRIIYAGSKLSLSHIGNVTSLWEICGIDGKVDVDNNPHVASQFGIRSIPTILFFKNGVQVDKQVGVVPKNILEGKLKALMS